MPSITIITNRHASQNIEVVSFPDTCPNCFNGINPTYLFGFRHLENDYIHLTFFCPIQSCNKDFVAHYQHGPSGHFLNNMYLGTVRLKKFSSTITSISPDFNTIYNQAQSAEDSNLSEICGVGYRKALEFLIKDYIISKDTKLRASVEQQMLGKCIKDYINNERIKEIAKRATWLGNDETHYVRKWIGKNVEDLKMLIDLTVHWIETEIITDELIAKMPE